MSPLSATPICLMSPRHTECVKPATARRAEPIYEIKRAKVGVFRDIDYADYPWPSQRSRGGKMGE